MSGQPRVVGRGGRIAPVITDGYIRVMEPATFQVWIKCGRCRRKSFNPNDVEYLYCGHCKAFHARKDE